MAERTTDGEAMLYLHHVPGRLHLRLAALKGDGSAAARACAIAKAIPGVVDARTNGAGAARAEPSPPADNGAQPFRDIFVRAALNRLAQHLAPALVGALV